MFGALIIILIVNLAAATPATLVPRQIGGNQWEARNPPYVLSIRHPVGTSVRRESVQETEPGNPKLSGVFQQTFDIEGGKLLVIYMAGQNGYFANYRYTATGKPMDIPFAILGLSPNLLKSAAG
ncbi:uncharacterized protein LOC108597491 [Drosophila busckii]|uniref:uncharacterized protein LOC108597491 n=1 Tax=Drosophila busckii TaxID=30019 RepID=UPI00083EEE09|nr:uncharacterized protein LOC108597491 [Drosophila busckii]